MTVEKVAEAMAMHTAEMSNLTAVLAATMHAAATVAATALLMETAGWQRR